MQGFSYFSRSFETGFSTPTAEAVQLNSLSHAHSIPSQTSSSLSEVCAKENMNAQEKENPNTANKTKRIHEGDPVPHTNKRQALTDVVSNDERVTSRRSPSQQQQPVQFDISNFPSISQTGEVVGVESDSPMELTEELVYDLEVSGLSSDPRDCREYAKRSFHHLRDLELRRRPRVNYMSKQRDINMTMRAMLIDWLVDVTTEFELCSETLFVTVNLIDRFLSLMHVARSRLQLVGVAAMLIASKFEEIHAPYVREFVYICDFTYTAEEITLMELQILSSLKFDICCATIHAFANRFLKFIHADEQTNNLVFYLIELSLLEYNFIHFVSSEIAASAIVLALHTLHKPHWNQNMHQFFGYSLDDLLDECIPQLFTVFQQAHSSNLRAIFDKYNVPALHYVARLSPRGNVDDILC